MDDSPASAKGRFKTPGLRNVEFTGESWLDPVVARGAKVEAASLVTDLNVVMTWISYPGRRNGTAKAEEVDFHAIAGAKQ